MEEKLGRMLSLFYHSSHIPVSFYTKKGCIYSYVPVVFKPDIAYCILKDAIKAQNTGTGYICCCDIYFGFIHITEDGCILVGPVCGPGVAHKQCAGLLKELNISLIKIKELEYMLDKIPHIGRSRFLSTLRYLDFLFNGEREFVPADLSSGKIFKEQEMLNINAGYKTGIFPVHDTEVVERKLLNMVSFGKTDELINFLKKLTNAQFSSGDLAGDSLRIAKNTFISATAIISRTAVREGMDYDQSLTLSDSYIRKIEFMDNIQEIVPFIGSMMVDYCKKIRKIKQYKNCSSLTYAIIDDIQRHIYQAVTLTGISERIGFSVSYISAVFKKETGISVKEFIQKEKINEAKYMLCDKENSLTYIAEALCYSSVSHFQTSFKKITGTTPGQYRREKHSLF